jgi:hypothetical protein
MKTSEQWQELHSRLMEVRGNYTDPIGTPGVNVMFALSQVDGLLKRYNGGERSDKLWKEMWSME